MPDAREDRLRAALEAILDYFADPPEDEGFEYHACYLPRVIAEEALAEVDAMPVDEIGEAIASGVGWRKRAVDAEARLAQIAGLGTRRVAAAA